MSIEARWEAKLQRLRQIVGSERAEVLIRALQAAEDSSVIDDEEHIGIVEWLIGENAQPCSECAVIESAAIREVVRLNCAPTHQERVDDRHDNLLMCINILGSEVDRVRKISHSENQRADQLRRAATIGLSWVQGYDEPSRTLAALDRATIRRALSDTPKSEGAEWHTCPRCDGYGRVPSVNFDEFLVEDGAVSNAQAEEPWPRSEIPKGIVIDPCPDGWYAVVEGSVGSWNTAIGAARTLLGLTLKASDGPNKSCGGSGVLSWKPDGDIEEECSGCLECGGRR